MSYVILFKRVGKTKTGRPLFKLSRRDGTVFGGAFCIKSERRKAKR